MTRFLGLAGLLVAVLSALSLLLLPVEMAFGVAFGGLLFGLGLFFLGAYLRVREHRGEVRAAMKRFASANRFTFEESRSADGLPDSLSIFRRGTHRRCANVIGVEVRGHAGLLFHLQYWVPGGGRHPGHWEEVLVAYFPGARAGQVAFQLCPAGVLDKLGDLFVEPDSAPPETPAGARFSRLYRLEGSETEAIRNFFDSHRRAYFAEHPGQCAECQQGDLAVWGGRLGQGLAAQWRSAWDRSLRPVADWLPEELAGLLEVARQLLADRAGDGGARSEGR